MCTATHSFVYHSVSAHSNIWIDKVCRYLYTCVSNVFNLKFVTSKFILPVFNIVLWWIHVAFIFFQFSLWTHLHFIKISFHCSFICFAYGWDDFTKGKVFRFGIIVVVNNWRKRRSKPCWPLNQSSS